MKQIDMSRFPETIDAGLWQTGHIQGIAVDPVKEYIYYSFTTILVKAKLDGTVVGWVGGIIGHLGCIDFNDEDGRVYGSLELKHDSIGQGIMRGTGVALAEEDAFYIAMFDVDRITACGMDAERDGIMKAVYLPDVVRDYTATLPDGTPHKYACSGVDGLSIGPIFGAGADSPAMLMIAYGVYGDVAREDNDCNVILQYDWRKFEDCARALTQQQPHHEGLEADARYFVYTGNTTWGVQNLEYDAETNLWFMAVYKGKKEQFANFSTFVVDGSKAPRKEWLQGVEYLKKGKVLSLLDRGEVDAKNPEIRGWRDDIGAKGLCAIGDGYFYAAQGKKTKQGHDGYARLYRFVGGEKQGFELVE